LPKHRKVKRSRYSNLKIRKIAINITLICDKCRLYNELGAIALRDNLEMAVASGMEYGNGISVAKHHAS
jgi:hypothetical protein